MILIPVQPIPQQTLTVNVAGQSAQIALRQNGSNIYLDLIADSVSIVNSRICRDRQRLLLNAAYHGFEGDFTFIDSQGTDNPFYTGLGLRYNLYYIGAGE